MALLWWLVSVLSSQSFLHGQFCLLALLVSVPSVPLWGVLPILLAWDLVRVLCRSLLVRPWDCVVLCPVYSRWGRGEGRHLWSGLSHSL